MGITTCRTCGKDVDSNAKTCPGCGAKNPGLKPKDMVVRIIVFVIIVGGITKCTLSDDKDKPTAVTQPAAAAQPTDTNDASSNAQLVNNERDDAKPQFDTGLRGPDAKIMSGANNGSAGGKAAQFELPISDDEAKYLSDMPCQENGCYGNRDFYRFITKTYPDIGNIAFPKDKALKGLPEDELEPFKNDFYRALYLAKRINLANGQTLFDFMEKCSKGFGSTDQASFNLEKNESIQFFPVLRRLDNGKEEDMQILFDRTGAKVTARSPWFSTHIIQDQDFLAQHGLRCWSKS